MGYGMTDSRSDARRAWLVSQKTTDAIAKREAEKAKPKKEAPKK